MCCFDSHCDIACEDESFVPGRSGVEQTGEKPIYNSDTARAGAGASGTSGLVVLAEVRNAATQAKVADSFDWQSFFIHVLTSEVFWLSLFAALCGFWAIYERYHKPDIIKNRG